MLNKLKCIKNKTQFVKQRMIYPLISYSIPILTTNWYVFWCNFYIHRY